MPGRRSSRPQDRAVDLPHGQDARATPAAALGCMPTRSMASSSAGMSIGFIRWMSNPAARLSSMSSDEPKPDSAIAGTG